MFRFYIIYRYKYVKSNAQDKTNQIGFKSTKIVDVLGKTRKSVSIIFILHIKHNEIYIFSPLLCLIFKTFFIYL